MNTGQMMLTICAMFLLSMTILTVSRGTLSTNSTMVDSRYDILAVAVATSIIEDATGLAFDNNTASAAITSLNSLTAVASLGKETGEAASNPAGFNDFDDYNVYKDTTNAKKDTITVQGQTGKRIIFKTVCKVDYVSANNPSATSASRTWHKRLRLFVYNPEIRDPITRKTDTVKISTVFSYWYFR